MIDFGTGPEGLLIALKSAFAVALGQWIAQRRRAKRMSQQPPPEPPYDRSKRRKYRKPDYWGESKAPCASNAPSGDTADDRIIDATGRAIAGRRAIAYSKIERPAGE